MEEKKKRFLEDFSKAQKPKNPKEAFPFFTSYLKKAKQENIIFTKNEKDTLIYELTKDLPPSEKEQIQNIIKLFN